MLAVHQADFRTRTIALKIRQIYENSHNTLQSASRRFLREASQESTMSSVSIPIILNLGCGRKKMANSINVDITNDTSPDIVHNLNVRPWPFPDNHFTEVHAYDVIEHLTDVLGTVNELYRVCQNGAMINITVPHYSSSNAFTDPTHQHYFGWFSFDYFTGEHEHCYYTRSRFQMNKRAMMFRHTLVNKLIRRMANRWPARYEQAWAWTFPAWFLWYRLEVLKEATG